MLTEYDRIWWNGTGHVWPQFFNCFHAAMNSSQWLVSVAVCCSFRAGSCDLGSKCSGTKWESWAWTADGKWWKDITKLPMNLPPSLHLNHLGPTEPEVKIQGWADHGASSLCLWLLQYPSTLSRVYQAPSCQSCFILLEFSDVLGSSSMSDAYRGSRTSSNVSHSVCLRTSTCLCCAWNVLAKEPATSSQAQPRSAEKKIRDKGRLLVDSNILLWADLTIFLDCWNGLRTR